MKAHWEHIYKSKSDQDMSWYQEVPSTSLRLVEELELGIKDHIIDVGGGNSRLGWQLCDRGFKNVSVLDISGVCLAKMREKNREKAEQINWIESDILSFNPAHKYRLWHDRAVFHFLTNPNDRRAYGENLVKAMDKKGYFILSAFSIDGPVKCSGLDICQYDLPSLKSLFSSSFELLNAFNEDHVTPAGKTQNFIFTIWQKLHR